MVEKRLVNLLWTGGLDSTCRLVELSRFPYVIQPYYLIDPGRRSVKNEIAAMDKIRTAIVLSKKTECDLRLTKFVRISDIPEDNEITESWRRLHATYGIGSQYDWLARCAKEYEILLEIGLQFSHYGNIVRCIEENSKFLHVDDDSYHALMIDPDHSLLDVQNVFGRFVFPLSIYHKSKQDEVLMMRKLTGDDSITLKTWFCHHPILGLPCGHCHPCLDVIHEGMSWRIPRLGYFLGQIMSVFSHIHRR